MNENKISSIAWLNKLDDLLKSEYEYEKATFRRQTELVGIRRWVERGLCWFPLRLGKSYYNAFDRLVVEVERTESTDVEHSFEHARPVCFFTEDASGRLHYLSFVAEVNYADDLYMTVTLPSASALIELQRSERLGVQLYFDEYSYRTMFQALRAVRETAGNRLAELRELFHGNGHTSVYSFSPIRFPWLNRSQEEAVNRVLHAKDVAVVHGPPGTGKTTTLVEAIYETLHRESQVLVCAQSNMAVDCIAEKLIDRGVNVLRIGNPAKVNDKMLSFTYERRFESHPDYPQLWSIRQAIRQLYEQRRKKISSENFHQKINSLKDRATELEIRINESLFAQARVIASTLVGSNHGLLDRIRFGTLFIDEAAQALEPACWIAIRKADRVILAGDHCQLPPTIKNPEAMRNGLGTTLMQSLVRKHPEAVSLLRMQYRMNDDIMRFSSEWFYEGKVVSAPEVRYRSILDFDTPIEWINTENMESSEHYINEGVGRINESEAELCVMQLKQYIERIGKVRFLDERIDIGLISPYKAQTRYLRKLIKQDSFFKPFRQFITINTVDGFQGQERDVIMISLVRANDEGNIGFLSDLRRMNVAITRARMKLIILGDASTLCRHPFYDKLYQYIENLSI